jgi:hypothetical protein
MKYSFEISKGKERDEEAMKYEQAATTHPISCVNTIESQVTPAFMVVKDPFILVDTPNP